MMDNQSQYNPIFNDRPKQDLKNATGVLVLGIISIIGCFCNGLPGLICGIIALILAKQDTTIYNLTPDNYTQTSYNNLKAGRVCAIIGVVLSSLCILFFIIVLGVERLFHPGELLNHYGH